MGETSIQWTDRTWNPVVGCTRVTSGCDHCYAFALHDRRHALYQRHGGHWSIDGGWMPAQYAKPFSVVQLLPERLHELLHIKKPTRFFVNSMSDVFHSAIPDDFIRDLFAVMAEAHWHTFQILTKRAGRLRLLGPTLPWPHNVWVGVSIEEDRLTPRANALRAVPAAVRFISAEPLLGPLPSLDLTGIDWLIVGGESGPGHRPLDYAWVRDLRDRCTTQHVPFFFKQWGGLTPKSGGDRLDGLQYQMWPVPQIRRVG